MAGVARADRIRNEKIRERFGIAPIADKLFKTHLRWYRHVLCANYDTACKLGLDVGVPGKRPKERPKQRWLDTLHADLKHVCVHLAQAHESEMVSNHENRPNQRTGLKLKKKKATTKKKR
ncbi:hypothetical protein Y032_0403g828 [Ancylostoma ceylanicum]|uniref:Uncharacterized protein n=1 Tax=Ancylostoma ceylanicum TaxID=53326 RepID=A0A016X347_9BILA|nr:hypothetical protein Y032_0403g828 [Ancylostoma ceylanicum]